MFDQLSLATSARRRIMVASVALHGLVFAWMLHAPEPPLLQANSVAPGHNGRVLEKIYFPSPTPDDSTTSSPNNATQVYRHQRLGHEKLTWKPTPAQPKHTQAPNALARSGEEDKSDSATLSKLGHGAAAGLPYGSLPGSPIYGDEIRPALPIATADPVIYPWQRPEYEGKVIVEITIDERGEITRKTVLQSMGADIDNKCLAALENWHFQPATRNGVPIPSKQDAIFPFKPRGVSETIGQSSSAVPAIMQL